MDDEKRLEEYEQMHAAYMAEPFRPSWAEFCARYEEEEDCRRDQKDRADQWLTQRGG